MQNYSYRSGRGQETILAEDAGRVWLRRLCGVSCGNDGEDTGPIETQGPAILVTSLGRFEGDAFQLVDRTFDAQTARLAWTAADGALRLESVWTFCPETGVVSRKDRLTNTGSGPVTVFRVQSRFAFPSGRYEVYAQQSRWCNENQGKWMGLHAGSLRFGCVQGRTTQGGTPYLCLREIDADRGLAFHVLPCGNWSIEASARPIMDVHPFAVLNLGLADGDLRLELQPGKGDKSNFPERPEGGHRREALVVAKIGLIPFSAGEAIECPEILIQSLPDAEPSSAAPRLHCWWQRGRHTPCAVTAPTSAEATAHGQCLLRSELPVVFNTWFDQFEVLDVPRLRQQLQAAKQVGCEVFVIDAGWYGPQAGGWWFQAGDWRERIEAAFCGRMADFAEEVRAAGLGFGLWMEPERFGADVPIRREHPEWFYPGQPPFARIDLENPAAYAYVRNEISRLVETYDLAWMKIDFNFELGFDGSGGELSGYYEAWYRMLDEIRQKHPRTVFEGCSSGAMRLELASLSHVDGHFLTDTVNPVDVLRIMQGALLRLPPGYLTKWAVLRSIGQTIPRYTKSLADSPVSIVTPCGALWEPSETAELDFVVAAAMPGVLGLGGDVAGLSVDAKTRLAEHVAFYKQWQTSIRRSIAHLLTPPALKTDREGWVALQLSDPETGSALLFVYRLNDGSSTKRFALRELDGDENYQLAQYMPSGTSPRTMSGADLMAEGIDVTLAARYQAAIFALTPLK